MSNKKLSERLNNELDALGVPGLMIERVEVCSKLFKLPKFKAEAVLNGMILDTLSIQTIAKELEVSADWLLGLKNEKDKQH
ncbi:hypothetical protein [Legionella hackeliae]|uniref:HTH cro/C1-type domain-containing protein n=1 Tax=Legionella hackeliae TaxID=449 RepID=A0A0A8UK39_LEGHA|nr:hypothetical protein [Legionella hackeliae]KTD12911.1 hypothetical protein Lhac_1782 [Legionella hackeliae]CEK09220.1 conserved protein of unknown function [Legionella hackeliae]STX49127.1 Uncharacterised protein [Legionella hackeliae]